MYKHVSKWSASGKKFTTNEQVQKFDIDLSFTSSLVSSWKSIKHNSN